MRFWLIAFCVLANIRCATEQPDNTYKTDPNRPIVDDKYSLRADREQLAQLRSEIPEQKRNENDELALILNLMAEVGKPPSEIRSKFDQGLRKKRSQFDKDIRKEREEFTKKERVAREAFLKELKETREVKQREKLSREDRVAFFKQLDEKRQGHFSVEKDRRQDFESDVRERRKNFEDYSREKQNQFNQEYRSYYKRYEEKRSEDLKKERKANISTQEEVANERASLDRELDEIKQKKGYFLQSGDLDQ